MALRGQSFVALVGPSLVGLFGCAGQGEIGDTGQGGNSGTGNGGSGGSVVRMRRRPDEVRVGLQGPDVGSAELRRVRQRVRHRADLPGGAVPVQRRTARLRRRLRRLRRHPLRRLLDDVRERAGLQRTTAVRRAAATGETDVRGRRCVERHEQRAPLRRRAAPVPGRLGLQRRRLRLLGRGPDAVRERVRRRHDQQRSLRRLQPGLQRHVHERPAARSCRAARCCCRRASAA